MAQRTTQRSGNWPKQVFRLLAALLIALGLLPTVPVQAGITPPAVTALPSITYSTGTQVEFFGSSVSVDGSTMVVGAKGVNSNQGAALVYELVSGAWQHRATLTASDGAMNDYFGCSVSISGDTVVVGAWNGTAADQGAAYIFVKPAGGWSGNRPESAKLTASDGNWLDRFGNAVSISGDTVVVGAYQDNLGQGRAYVFVKPAGGWSGNRTESASLVAVVGTVDGTIVGPIKEFGCSVSISGDTVVVGADATTVGGNNLHGAAYVFVRPGGGWSGTSTQTATLTAWDGEAGDRFGNAVAINGSTIVIGARKVDFGSILDQGAVYVYEKSGGLWVDTSNYTARLTAADGAAHDYFGTAVAIHGDTVVVGADADDAAFLDQGSAYVFVKPSAFWTTMTSTTKLTAADGAGFKYYGNAVAVSGENIVIGNSLELSSGTRQGWVYPYLFRYYPKAITPSPLSGTAAEYYGWSVAVDGSTMVVGAYGNASGKGAAYVYELSGGLWQHKATLTASDGAAGYNFGYSVGISGSTVVVGAWQTTVDGKGNQGAAYVFVKPSGGWASTGTFNAKLTASDGVADVSFGSSVAISGDTIVVGAYRDDISGNTDQGSAYVFVKPSGGWASTSTYSAKLTASTGAAYDRFGDAVAISGDTVVVGVKDSDPGGNTSKGTAYVFEKPVSWSGSLNQSTILTANDGLTYDKFGASVAISGDTIVVGAPEDDIIINEQGSAYVFEKSGSWIQTAKLSASNGSIHDHFGSAVALSGDTIVVGAGHDTFDNITYRGSAYLFVKPGAAWSSTSNFNAQLIAVDSAENNYFGASVAISGGVMAAGAYGRNGYSGAVYTYALGSYPTAARLANFEAGSAGQGLTLTWQTASEQGLYGFNLHRSAGPDGEKVQLNDGLLPATNPNGGAYNFTAAGQAQPGDMYWLEIVSEEGSEFYGPLAVALPRVYLPWLSR